MTMWMKPLVPLSAALLLSACGAPSGSASNETASAEGNVAGVQAAPVQLTVPAGAYKLDPTHAFLRFTVEHFGLSDYTMKFTKFDSTIDLDPADVTKSKVVLNIDPASVRTDYPADYKATHPKSTYPSWDVELGTSPQYLNAPKFPQIVFTSTKVEQTGPGTAKVTGDLAFLGMTKPVTMTVTLHGQVATHPVQHKPAIGLHAEGTFKRTDFGMRPGPISDTVTVVFDGEFLRDDAGQAPAAAAP